MQAAFAAAGIEEQPPAGSIDYGGLSAAQLEAAVRPVDGWLDEGHRSTCIAAPDGSVRRRWLPAWWRVRDGVGIDEALAQVQARKPSADPLPHQREDLRRWWETQDPARDRAPLPSGGSTRLRRPLLWLLGRPQPPRTRLVVLLARLQLGDVRRCGR